MPSWLPSIPYTDEHTGYWDPVTSTLNWCEERPIFVDQDYYLTQYAAEVVNTFTNILFLRFAYVGIRSCLRHGHDSVFLVAFIGYLLVGTGSFLFHATLKYPMQLVDELSMIYTTCLMCHATFGFDRSRNFRIVLGLGLVALAGGVTAYYHYLQDPKFHQTTYAALTTVIVFRCVWIMETTLRPKWRRKSKRSQSEGTVQSNGSAKGKTKDSAEALGHPKDEDILRTMWIMFAIGLSTFLAGFYIWLMDNVHCSQLRRWRRQVGLPWGVLLEGHGWWHLMTGTGAYYYITWGIWLRHCLKGEQGDYDLVWPSLWSLPEIVKVRSGGNGVLSKKKGL